MKLSVSLPEEDVAFLDQFAADSGAESRSSVVQMAIAMLRTAELADDYQEAFAEWNDHEGPLWEAVSGDGLLAQ